MQARTFEILLVEDNPADVYIFRQALKEADLEFHLTHISDGEKALVFVSRVPGDAEFSVPDIAVLDLNLPRLGGIEILQALRENKHFRNVPVLILTSSADPNEQRRVTELGIERFLTKPPELEDFLRIGQLIKEILLKPAMMSPS